LAWKKNKKVEGKSYNFGLFQTISLFYLLIFRIHVISPVDWRRDHFGIVDMISDTVLEDVGSSQERWKIARQASFMADQEGIVFAVATSSANQLVSPERLGEW
jgi:hypothetical protein